MLINLPNPFALDTTTDPLSVGSIKATDLQFADTQTRQGRIMRGRGMARCVDVAGNASTVVACGVFIRKDCRRVLLSQDAAGVVTLSMGPGTGIAGFPCAGPLSEWSDLELEIGDQLVYVKPDVSPESAPSSLSSVPVVSGHTYQIDTQGTWWHGNGIGRIDADGTLFFGTGPDAGPFAGTRYGKLFVHDPGNTTDLGLAGAWTAIGKNGSIKVTGTGNLLLCFSDQGGSFPSYGYYYTDNYGVMAARVRDIT